MSMKKYPKLVTCDERGQLVIPRDIRLDLGIAEGTGFWVYLITDEGILLKKVDPQSLDQNSEIMKTLEDKSDKIRLDRKNLTKTLAQYKKNMEGNLEVIE